LSSFIADSIKYLLTVYAVKKKEINASGTFGRHAELAKRLATYFV